MSASMSDAITAEPNLTPLLDVVFQLITFFMLLINFSQDNYDKRVRLPVATSARPVEDSAEDRVVINVDKEGRMLFNGQTLDAGAAAKEIAQQAKLARFNLKIAGKSDQGPLPTTLVIRADRDTPFRKLNTLITACQKNGFHKFALKAMSSGPSS